MAKRILGDGEKIERYSKKNVDLRKKKTKVESHNAIHAAIRNEDDWRSVDGIVHMWAPKWPSTMTATVSYSTANSVGKSYL